VLAAWLAGVRERLQQAEAEARASEEKAQQLLERERNARAAAERSGARARLRGRVGELLDAAMDPVETLERATGLVVPDMGDLCVVDLREPDGTIRGVAVTAADPGTADALRQLRERYPLDPQGEHPVARVLRTARGEVLPELPADDLERYSASEEHLEFMKKLRYSAAIVAPLRARGRTLGAISVLRLSGQGSYDEEELALLEELARPAALAIDNARLFGELVATERQMEALLGELGESVTVQDTTGKVVYANQAAADLLGYASGDEVVAAPLAELIGRFTFLGENREPFPLERLPGRQVLAGETPEPALVRHVTLATGEERWAVIKASAVRNEEGEVILAVNVIEDVTDVKRQELAQRFLSQASKFMATSLDPALTLEKIAWTAVPEIADWCGVDLLNERGMLRRVAIAHTDPGKLDLARELHASYPPAPDAPVGVPAVVRSGKAECYPLIDTEMLTGYALDERHLELLRALGTRSVLIVPMTLGDRTIGAITLATAESGRRLDDADLEVAEEFARRAAIAVDNARIHAESAEIAATLQEGLMPPPLPSIEGLELAARFRAAGQASEVGGDFYDFYAISDGWMIAIGDVTGKGPAAAAITALARYTMRTAALYENRPSGVLARLNDVLRHDGQRHRLCTAVGVKVAAGSTAITVASGGHPAPLLARPGGEVVALGAPGTLLGAFSVGQWTDSEVELQPGETVVLYTDGVTDTRGRDGELFGPERLADLLARIGRLPADAMADAIEQALLDFQDGNQRDDVAFLVLRCVGAVAPRVETSAAAIAELTASRG
jgi:PAS domain S-box-containing protein